MDVVIDGDLARLDITKNIPTGCRLINWISDASDEAWSMRVEVGKYLYAKPDMSSESLDLHRHHDAVICQIGVRERSMRESSQDSAAS